MVKKKCNSSQEVSMKPKNYLPYLLVLSLAVIVTGVFIITNLAGSKCSFDDILEGAVIVDENGNELEVLEVSDGSIDGNIAGQAGRSGYRIVVGGSKFGATLDPICEDGCARLCLADGNSATACGLLCCA